MEQKLRTPIINLDKEYEEGYYWARHKDNTHFVVYKEGHNWYTVGIGPPMVNFDPNQIIMRIPEPHH